MLIHDVALHLLTMSDFSPQVVSSVFRGPSNRSHVDRALADIKIFMLYGLAWLQLKKKRQGGVEAKTFLRLLFSSWNHYGSYEAFKKKKSKCPNTGVSRQNPKP